MEEGHDERRPWIKKEEYRINNKRADRSRLSEDVRLFIENGGQVTHIANGVSGEWEGKLDAKRGLGVEIFRQRAYSRRMAKEKALAEAEE